MSWEALRSEARQLETSIEEKLVAFQRFGRESGSRDGAGAEGMFESMTLELQQLLIKLSGINDSMQEVVSESPSQRHTLSRHSALLNEYQHEFTKTKHSIRQKNDREALLSSVQRDISSYQNEQAMRQEQKDKTMRHTTNAMRGAQDSISIAMEAKAKLVGQRGMLQQVSTKMQSIAAKFPVMNNIMQKIQYRKNRDKMIMAVVIASCVFFLMWYSFLPGSSS